MGFDVYGMGATKEEGKYFRNNVWWWRPLWAYCKIVAPDLCRGVDGDTNSGDGLGPEESEQLANILDAELDSGDTALYASDYQNKISMMPRERCSTCDATGIRTDAVGVGGGWPSVVLDLEIAAQVGRLEGSCNACGGLGHRSAYDAAYPFDVDNVREFAAFCRHSGGFAIQ